MSDHILREAAEGDAAEIARIEKLSFPTPWTAEMILSEMREPLSSFFVIENNNSIIGYYGFLHILDELHILNVAVDPPYRGRNVGSALMEHLLERGRTLSVRAVTLEVRESNLPAIKLYEKYGFHSVGIRPHYYTDKENALIYWLEL